VFRRQESRLKNNCSFKQDLQCTLLIFKTHNLMTLKIQFPSACICVRVIDLKRKAALKLVLSLCAAILGGENIAIQFNPVDL